MPPLFSIIIPTWNNPQYFNPCIESIDRTGVLNGLGEVIVINNGKQPIKERYSNFQNVKVIDCPENLGWERGLEEGLKHTTAPFVCFQNDDTFIPHANANVYQQLLYPFSDENVAAVGPATTIASGYHSIYMANPLREKMIVPYLIFFTVMVRREHYDLVGGIDTTCPGGDDFDLSMRFTKAGKKLIVNPDAFLIHHAFKTGERVRGSSSVAGGWNSQDMTDNTNRYLITKHGFRAHFDTRRTTPLPVRQADSRDLEGATVASFVDGSDVVEIGCGYRKTVPNAIGVDRVIKGEPIPHVPGGVSVADIIADVTGKLPINSLSKDTVIARHILEHCIDPVSTIKEWARILKIGGRMVLALPDQDKGNMIPLNPEHVHAYTVKTLKNLMELCGFKQIFTQDPMNGISFVSCFEKVIHIEEQLNGKTSELLNA